MFNRTVLTLTANSCSVKHVGPMRSKTRLTAYRTASIQFLRMFPQLQAADLGGYVDDISLARRSLPS